MVPERSWFPVPPPAPWPRHSHRDHVKDSHSDQVKEALMKVHAVGPSATRESGKEAAGGMAAIKTAKYYISGRKWPEIRRKPNQVASK